MDQTFKITVILPVYNGIRYLQESVQSVLDQTYVDFEFIICDDCSTDESYTYLKSLNDSRIKLIRNEENKGLFPTLNILIKQSHSELIHLWAQDDIMYENCLEETLKFHQKFPDVSFSFSRCHFIDDKGEILGKKFDCEDHTISPYGHAKSSILYGSIAGNIANVTLVKSEVEKAGYFNEQMKYCGDFEMWYKLCKTKHAGLSGSYLIKLRNHKEQLSRNIEASYFKLKENLEIYAYFVQFLPANKHRIAKKALSWKIYPHYFNQFLYILFHGKYKLAFRYIVILRKYDYLFLLAFRWIIVRILRVIKREQKLFNHFVLKF